VLGLAWNKEYRLPSALCLTFLILDGYTGYNSLFSVGFFFFLILIFLKNKKTGIYLLVQVLTNELRSGMWLLVNVI
jgi:hypothetical protein